MNETGNSIKIPTGSKRRILVVDDEQVVLDAAKRILTAEGFEVMRTLDAETAIALMETMEPDIVIVDLKLPGMSGLEFIEAIRSDHPDLTVIVMTGVSSADQAIAALNTSAFDFLPKPFTFEELLSPVSRAARYIDLSATAQAHPGDKSLEGYFFLGIQSWAKLDDGETVRVGVSDLFSRTSGNVQSVGLPGSDDQISQGGPMATIRTVDGRSHVALSPISGTIVKINENLMESCHLVNQEATGRGWLAIVRPSNLEHELVNLRR